MAIFEENVEEEKIDEEGLSKEEQPQVEDEERMFLVNGNEVPFADLTREQVSSWYDANSNMESWQSSNTQKAQQLAKEKEQWEKNYPQAEKDLEEYRAWLGYFNANPELQTYVRDYHTRSQQGSQQNPQQNPQGMSQPNDQYRGELDELKQDVQAIKGGREEELVSKERNDALEALRKKDPNFDEAKFLTHLNKVTGSMDNLSQLYSLVYDAYKGGSLEQIKTDAKNEVVENIKKKGAASIERGNATSTVDIPDNIDISGKGYDDIFDEFKEQKGIKEETGVEGF